MAGLDIKGIGFGNLAAIDHPDKIKEHIKTSGQHAGDLGQLNLNFDATPSMRALFPEP